MRQCFSKGTFSTNLWSCPAANPEHQVTATVTDLRTAAAEARFAEWLQRERLGRSLGSEGWDDLRHPPVMDRDAFFEPFFGGCVGWGGQSELEIRKILGGL